MLGFLTSSALKIYCSSTLLVCISGILDSNTNDYFSDAKSYIKQAFSSVRIMAMMVIKPLQKK
jgi:hypothetical protein